MLLFRKKWRNGISLLDSTYRTRAGLSGAPQPMASNGLWRKQTDGRGITRGILDYWKTSSFIHGDQRRNLTETSTLYLLGARDPRDITWQETIDSSLGMSHIASTLAAGVGWNLTWFWLPFADTVAHGTGFSEAKSILRQTGMHQLTMALAKIDLHFNVRGGGAVLYLTTLFIANIMYVIGASPMKYKYAVLSERHWLGKPQVLGQKTKPPWWDTG